MNQSPQVTYKSKKYANNIVRLIYEWKSEKCNKVMIAIEINNDEPKFEIVELSELNNERYYR